MVSDVEENFTSEAQPTYFVTHDVYQVSSSPKGIFVDLHLSLPAAKPLSLKRLKFQVDCNTIHVSDLNNLLPVQVNPSHVHLLDYSKAVIPTKGQATLQCNHHGKVYKTVVQVITAQCYYPPLLGLADSTRMGIINYDVDTANQLDDSQVAVPPIGELSLNLKLNNTYLEVEVR